MGLLPQSTAQQETFPTTLADMERLKCIYEKVTWNVDLGALIGFNNDISSNKILLRLDYNINKNHKLAVRYSFHNFLSWLRELAI